MKKIFLLSLIIGLIATNLFADTITNISYINDIRFTGRGNKNVLIEGLAFTYSGSETNLNSLTINFNGTTNTDDITKINVYLSQNSIFPERENELQNFQLIGSENLTDINSQFSIPISGNLNEGNHYLYVTCDIAEDAGEGNIVQCQMLELATATNNFTLPETDIEAKREILLCRKLVYQPGDYGSGYYRIPAIVTAKDGSLVIATDKRKYSQGDLPGDIDVVVNRSTDNGKTWSEPYTLAQGSGEGKGFGDAALCQSQDPNGLICVFVGGDGLWESVVTSGKKIRSYMCRSNDNGITWTDTTEITHFIYGTDCIDTQRRNWKASFFGSGRGLKTSSGRIMFAIAARLNTSYTLYNYVVYSDDNGETWNVSNRASTGGDEAKLEELGQDTIVMSIRHSGNRWYNISTDGGITWQSNVSQWTELNGNACNADIIRYTSVRDGYDRNRMLHSLVSHEERRDVSMYISYDETESWQLLKNICPYGAAYSSLTILPDGTIGIYVEENYNTEKYSTYFMNFSLDWLTDGNDHYTAPNYIQERQTENSPFKTFYDSTDNCIKILGNKIKSVSIYDNSGKIIDSQNFKHSENVKINASSLKNGIYFITITDKNEASFTHKVPVIR